MKLAIVDVGTNSIHLHIGMLGRNGAFRPMLKERDLTRLGTGGLVADRLTAPAMRRALQVLRRYARIIRRLNVERVEAVATSAVREAANGRAFVRRVRAACGIPLRIISGREEARLIALGVLRRRRLRGMSLLLTVGGGSAQVVLGDGARLRCAVSLPLGGARLAQRFIRHDPARPAEVAALAAHVERALAPVARRVRRSTWRHAFACSATIRHLMEAAYLQAHPRVPRHTSRLGISRRALERLVEWLARSRAGERVTLRGLDPRRQDLALPTGLVMARWMALCGIPRLQFAPGSLREGLAAVSSKKRALL